MLPLKSLQGISLTARRRFNGWLKINIDTLVEHPSYLSVQCVPFSKHTHPSHDINSTVKNAKLQSKFVANTTDSSFKHDKKVNFRGAKIHRSNTSGSHQPEESNAPKPEETVEASVASGLEHMEKDFPNKSSGESNDNESDSGSIADDKSKKFSQRSNNSKRPPMNPTRPKEPEVEIIKNGMITAETIRVNWFEDVLEGAEKKTVRKSQIMNRKEALAMAREKHVDLILVTPSADPPVCILMRQSTYMMEQRKKEAAIRKHQKLSVPKEVHMKVGIDLHDFETMMKRTKGFLEEGRPVKVIVKVNVRRPRPSPHQFTASKPKPVNQTSISTIDLLSDHLHAFFIDAPVSITFKDSFIQRFIPETPNFAGNSNTLKHTAGEYMKIHDVREFFLVSKSDGKNKSKAK